MVSNIAHFQVSACFGVDQADQLKRDWRCSVLMTSKELQRFDLKTELGAVLSSNSNPINIMLTLTS